MEQKSRDISVSMALGYGLDDRDSRVRFPAGAGNSSLHHRVQNGSGAHPASYPMGTNGSFPGGKAAGAWSSPLTNYYRRQRMGGTIPPLPSTPPRRGAQLKRRDKFILTLPWNRMLLKKVIVIQSRNSPPFMESERPSPCSQQPATGPYLEPDAASSHIPTLSP
jgi:hypothetical protein